MVVRHAADALAAGALADRTQQTYRSAVKKYLEFAAFIHMAAPFPLTDEGLGDFAAFLALSCGLAHESIRTYISGVKERHEREKHAPLPARLPFLSRVLAGIKRNVPGAAPRPAMPITLAHIRMIREYLGNIDDPSAPIDDICLFAACVVGFCGFLRKSNFLAGHGREADPSRLPRVADAFIIAVPGDPENSLVRLLLKSSKTDQHFEGDFASMGCLCRNHREVCPVHLLSALILRSAAIPKWSDLVSGDLYEGRQGSDERPLFLMADGRPLSADRFLARLRVLLSRAGIDRAYEYTTHSFRRGAATAGGLAGLSDAQLKSMGRWRSEVFAKYIDPDARRLAQATVAIADASMASDPATIMTQRGKKNRTEAASALKKRKSVLELSAVVASGIQAARVSKRVSFAGPTGQ